MCVHICMRTSVLFVFVCFYECVKHIFFSLCLRKVETTKSPQRKRKKFVISTDTSGF